MIAGTFVAVFITECFQAKSFKSVSNTGGRGIGSYRSVVAR